MTTGRDAWGRWAARPPVPGGLQRVRPPARTSPALATWLRRGGVELPDPGTERKTHTIDTPDGPVVIERKVDPGLNATLSAESEGVVVAMLAVTGIVDRVADLIVPGAFNKSLTLRTPKIVLYHDWQRPVGKCAPCVELMPGDKRLPAQLPTGEPWPSTAGALVARVVFNLKKREGADAWADAEFYGPDQEWSIGYNVPPGTARKRADGIRILPELDLYEGSEVLWGAMPLSRTVSVGTAA